MMDACARAFRLGLPTMVALMLLAPAASAVTLNVVGGQLLGASGVDVGGTLYDVAFLDGSCVSLFDGCDAPADFTFTTIAAAAAASNALLTQVFLDGGLGAFDTQPELTNGCTSLASCTAVTPYDSASGTVTLASGRNNAGATNDTVGGIGQASIADTTGSIAAVFAIWTPVPIPEPSTALLLTIGLVGLAAKRRGLS